MRTKPVPFEELKNIFVEMFLANTDKVTKVSPESVVNATAYGCAKLASKILKDVAVQEAQLFPDAAYGSYLDAIALRDGKPARYGALGSSTYIRLVGSPGTAYSQATHQFTGKHGIIFVLVNDITIGTTGFAYAKVQSATTGKFTNIDPLSLNKILPSAPTGHRFVINETKAQGGRDIEDDDTFRRRLKEGVNILARGTLAYYEQLFMKINSNVLKVYNGGFQNGTFILNIASVNGADFSAADFNAMLIAVKDFLTLSEFNSGLTLQNITWYAVDVSSRVELAASANADDVRVMMQVGINRLLDPRFWQDGGTIYFSDLLNVFRNTSGVTRLLDRYFTPLNDIIVPAGKLPRLRGFVLYDSNGVLISDSGGVLSPIYYPNDPNLIFQDSVIH